MGVNEPDTIEELYDSVNRINKLLLAATQELLVLERKINEKIKDDGQRGDTTIP